MGDDATSRDVAQKSQKYSRYFKRYQFALNAGFLFSVIVAPILLWNCPEAQFLLYGTFSILVIFRCLAAVPSAPEDCGLMSSFCNILHVLAVHIHIIWSQDLQFLESKYFGMVFMSRAAIGIGCPQLQLNIGLELCSCLGFILEILLIDLKPWAMLLNSLPSLGFSAAFVICLLLSCESDVKDVCALSESLTDQRVAVEKLLKSCFDATMCLEVSMFSSQDEDDSEAIHVVESSAELDALFGTPMVCANLLECATAGHERIEQLLNDVRSHNISKSVGVAATKDKEILRAFASFEGVRDNKPHEFDCEVRTVLDYGQFDQGRYRVLCGLQIVGEVRPMGHCSYADLSPMSPSRKRYNSPKSVDRFGVAGFTPKSAGSGELSFGRHSSSMASDLGTPKSSRLDHTLGDAMGKLSKAMTNSFGMLTSGGSPQTLDDVPSELLYDFSKQLFEKCGHAAFLCQVPDLTIKWSNAKTNTLFRQDNFSDLPLALLTSGAESYSTLQVMSKSAQAKGLNIERADGLRFRTFDEKTMVCDVVLIGYSPMVSPPSVIVAVLEQTPVDLASPGDSVSLLASSLLANDDDDVDFHQSCSTVLPGDSVSCAGIQLEQNMNYHPSMRHRSSVKTSQSLPMDRSKSG